MEKSAKFDELITVVRDLLKNGDFSNVNEHVAIHVNVTDLGQRPFYIEIDKGQVKVEPFGYYDYDAVLNADSEIILEMLNHKKDLRIELQTGRVGAYGNLYKLAQLRDAIVNA